MVRQSRPVYLDWSAFQTDKRQRAERAAYERGLEDGALKAEEYADSETNREVQGALRLFATRLRALKHREE